MFNEPTIKEVKERQAKFEEDMDEKDNVLWRKKQEALSWGNPGLAAEYEGKREELARQREQGKAVYRKLMIEAEEREDEKAAKAKAERQAQEAAAKEAEAKAKRAAYVEWIRGGGSPSEFDAIWAVMYQQMLQNKTLQKLAKKPDPLTF